jgi:hypothetical protein
MVVSTSAASIHSLSQLRVRAARALQNQLLSLIAARAL